MGSILLGVNSTGQNSVFGLNCVFLGQYDEENVLALEGCFLTEILNSG